MKNLLLTLIYVSVLGNGLAQVFTKTYGGLYGESQEIINLSNSDILLIGYTTDAPVGGSDVIVARADVNGDTLWQYTYGTAFDDEAGSTMELSDGSILVAHKSVNTSTLSMDIGVFKLDANGDLLWSKRLNTTPLSITPSGFKLLEINGEQYLAFWQGETISFVSLDANGQIVNDYTYSYQSANASSITDIDNSLSTDVAILVNESTATPSTHVVELSLTSGVSFSTRVSINSYNSGLLRICKQDTTYYLVGAEAGGFGNIPYYLLEINSAHTVKWCTQAYSMSGNANYPTEVVYANDSIYLGNGYNNVYIFDKNGNHAGYIRTQNQGLIARHLSVASTGHLRFGGYYAPMAGSLPFISQLDSLYGFGSCVQLQRYTYPNITATVSTAAGGTFVADVSFLSASNNLLFRFANYNHQSYKLDAYVVAKDVNCKSACDGEGEVVILGGSPPYNIVWSNAAVGEINDNLCPDDYICQIVDGKGCTLVDTITIEEPDTLILSANSVNTYCGGDTVAMSSTTIGGTAPYHYQWTAPQQVGMVCDSCPNSDLYTEFDQTWTITVTDTNGCTASDDVYVQTSEPVITEICVVTVDTGSTHNMVIWEKPAAPNLDHFRIYRDVVGTWYHIGDVPYDSLSQFVDTTFGIDPNATSYQYAISSVDTCGNESDLSAHHQTMHLTQNMGLGGEANLIWDNYEGFGFIFYRIMRDTGNGVFAVLDSVTATNTTYTDWNAPNNQTRYRIQIVLDQQCVSSRANHNTTRSNRTQPPSNGGGGSTDIVEVLVGDVSVYPNPSKGNVNIDLSSQTNLDAMISLYSMDGRLIKQFNKTIFEGDNQIQLNLDMLERGMYQLLIEGEGLKVVERIVKE